RRGGRSRRGHGSGSRPVPLAGPAARSGRRGQRGPGRRRRRRPGAGPVGVRRARAGTAHLGVQGGALPR
ncbi:response regulator containing a CheY-like receiver domain and an HTH DNA-binding domain, partial [Mycobacterium sp. PO1]